MKHIIWLQKSLSCAHFYRQTQWSIEKNQKIFGRCYTPYGHGHNYQVHVGFACKMPLSLTLKEQLEDILQAVCDPLDHEHLNFVIPEFLETIPTTENIARYLWKQIDLTSPPAPLLQLKLYETPHIWTELRV